MILITGANGFIGSHIAKLLVSQGSRVRGLVRRTGDLSNIKELISQIELIEGDVLDKASLNKAFKDVEACLHTAALVRNGDHPSADYFSTNLQGTMNVCEAAMNAQVKRFVYTSTCETLRAGDLSQSVVAPFMGPQLLPDKSGNYKAGGKCPPDHPAIQLITENIKNTYSNMVGDYGRSKFLAEEHVSMCVDRGLPAIILNPTGVVGAGDVNLTPPNALLLAYCKGEIPLHFETGFNVVDVRDVAKAHVLAMTNGKVGERYIIGHSNVMLSRIFKLLDEVSGRRHFSLKIPYFFVGVGMKFAPIKRSWKEKVAASKRPFFLDSSKAIRELGWKPIFRLEESLKNALEFKKQK